MSLGDARSYHLSTARNDLGVVHATSMAGGRAGPVVTLGVQRGSEELLLHARGGPDLHRTDRPANDPTHMSTDAGNPMVPVSWEEMRDPETMRTEKRKVAKVAAAVPA
jgi:exosome complex component CSL4